jgi:hypothetical protein
MIQALDGVLVAEMSVFVFKVRQAGLNFLSSDPLSLERNEHGSCKLILFVRYLSDKPDTRRITTQPVWYGCKHARVGQSLYTTSCHHRHIF